jgi:hypothetical protein
MSYAPDFYNPLQYNIVKRPWLLRSFPGLETVQVNHSQLHQDMFVLCVLDGLRQGSYLDIGAHEPVFINNTYLLEQRFGWNGLSVELCEAQVMRHREQRRNPCLLADATQLDYAAALRDAGLGPVIDYLSIDTDPPEVTLQALRRLPHDQFRFRVITFEHDLSAGGAEVRRLSRELLQSLGYELVVNDIAWGHRVVEDWWVAPELTNPAHVAQMRCLGDAAHDHQSYICGAYRADRQRPATTAQEALAA